MSQYLAFIFGENVAKRILGIWVTNGSPGESFAFPVAGASTDNFSPTEMVGIGDEALFLNVSTVSSNQLWVTNGTLAGTHTLAVKGAYTGAGGLDPSNLTAFGRRALFSGMDAKGGTGLWVTNGTAAGTKELTVMGAESEFGGLAPSDFTVFGKVALFGGDDAQGDGGLWETDGSSKGTKEIADVDPGAVENGNVPVSDITVVGDYALFEAETSSGSENLWVTNGKANGTLQIASGNVAFYPVGQLALTVLGDKTLFLGLTANGHNGALWVTNGSAAGTFEIASDRTNNPKYILYPQNITVIGNEAIFSGTDNEGRNNLWVTNGTSSGTHEIIVAGANKSRQGLVPTDFVALGDIALFSTLLTLHPGLWATNGTSAGTKELKVAGASSKGLYPGDFTRFGDKVLFVGYNASDKDALWETNGTSAGTKQVAIADAKGFEFYKLDGFTLNPGLVSVSNFETHEAKYNGLAGGFVVWDSGAKITAGLDALEGDVSHIASIMTVGGHATASTAAFTADRAALDKITGGYVVEDIAEKIGRHIFALDKDNKNIVSVRFTDMETAVLRLTANQSKADASLVAKIASPYVLDVTNSGSNMLTGHGSGLTIDDVKGKDTVTGGGTSETFVFGGSFGQATIADAHSHWTGKTHDNIAFATSEFANFQALLEDASVAHGMVSIARGSDHLVLDGFNTLAELKAGDKLGDFKFVA